MTAQILDSLTAAPAINESPAIAPHHGPVHWPPRRNLFGVDVSVTTCEEASKLIVDAAKKGVGGATTFLAVHGIVTGVTDKAYGEKVNAMDIVGPDGQPVRWALNLLHHAGLKRRVYGPEVTLHICRRAAIEGVGIYLYGSTHDVLVKMRSRLESLFPSLRVVGIESPPFRPLTEEEKEQAAQRIAASGAGIVFVGLGVPRQELFAADMRRRVNAVLVCVGAAFDFHAGNKPTAPQWMQKRGLEWVYRLLSEPRRLWKRYLVTNSIFLFLLLVSYLNPNRG